MKNIGIYRNFLGKYRINIGIFEVISEKKTYIRSSSTGQFNAYPKTGIQVTP